MPLSDAQKWLDPQPGDPTQGFITPGDVKASLAQTYADFPNLVPLQTTVAALSAAAQHQAPVANLAALPATGNADGDVRVTLDDHHMHVWVASSSQWTDIGSVTSPHTQVTFTTDKDAINPANAAEGDVCIVVPGAPDDEGGVYRLIRGVWERIGTVADHVDELPQFDATDNGRSLQVVGGQLAWGKHTLGSLTDTDASTAADGEVLHWDAATAKWVPGMPQMPQAPVNTASSPDAASLPPGTYAGELRTTVTPAEVWVWDGKKWVSQGPSTPENIAKIATGISRAEMAAAIAAAGLTTQHRDSVMDWTSTPPTLTNSDDDKGKLYIAKTTATGAWTGKDNHVMQWNGTSWDDLGMPVVGEARFDVAGGKILKWAPLPTGWHDLLGEFLPLTGGTLTGALSVGSTTVRVAPVGSLSHYMACPAANPTGTRNVVFGGGGSLTTGGSNTLIGDAAGGGVKTGSQITAVGRAAGVSVGDQSTAIGYAALQNSKGQYNTALGANCASKLVAGDDNTFFGATAGESMTGGNSGVAIGSHAQYSGPAIAAVGTTQSNWVAIGAFAYAAGNSVAIGSGSSAAPAHTTAANTVQLLPNATTGVKVYAGAERLFSLTELKAVVASATDFNDFKAKIAAIT